MISLIQSIPLPTVRSDRAAAVWRLFDLNRCGESTHHQPLACEQLRGLLPRPGCISLVTGPSGSGKSSLLREICTATGDRSINLQAIDLPDRPIVDCFDDLPLTDTMQELSRVGLCEAWTYLRTPDELSDGQRWRLRVALGLHRRRRESILFVDEFCTLLDRITASVIARMFRKSITGHCSAVVCTPHEDLIDPLQPDTLLYCDFGRITVVKIN